MVDCYHKKGLLRPIKQVGKIEDIFKKIENILGK